MTLKDFYDTVGGDYSEVLRRLCDDEIIYEFLFRFAEEPIFQKLQNALDTQNQKEAFTLIHTFKGTCLNMGLGSLYTSAVALTEALRSDISSDAPTLLHELAVTHQTVLDGIHSLKSN